MSRKYKFYNKEGLYFISFATVYWIDLFVRELYFELLIKSLDYCRREKSLEIYCYCIMPSHVHMIFRAKENNPSDVIRDFKKYTSKKLAEAIEMNNQESRKEWILWMMQRAGIKASNVTGRQLWQHHNKPIELWSNEVIDQKIDYIHNNPVISGFVTESWHWKYSSAMNYMGQQGVIEIDLA